MGTIVIIETAGKLLPTMERGLPSDAGYEQLSL
jgi:hypothetical protein